MADVDGMGDIAADQGTRRGEAGVLGGPNIARSCTKDYECVRESVKVVLG